MILLFYSNECKYCSKLLEYLKKNNLEKQFKMFNIDVLKQIPDNITIVPTIIDDTVEAPIEGKLAFEYVINQKYFNHPTNNINLWINNNIPKPNIEEDKKAIDKNNSIFSSINIEEDNTKLINNTKTINNAIPLANDKRTLALLKLRR